MLDTIKDIENFIIVHFKLNPEDFNLITNCGKIYIKIKKYFFNIKKFQKHIDDIRPIGVQILCNKITLIEWLLIKIKNLKEFLK